MSTDFDGPPIYDYLTKDVNKVNKDYMSNIWCDYWSTFYNTLVSYINSYGVFIPNRTQAEINSIQQPMIGQMIYNTSIDAPQIYTSTGWKTFTLF
jgi:hypothetical protein